MGATLALCRPHVRVPTQKTTQLDLSLLWGAVLRLRFGGVKIRGLRSGLKSFARSCVQFCGALRVEKGSYVYIENTEIEGLGLWVGVSHSTGTSILGGCK